MLARSFDAVVAKAASVIVRTFIKEDVRMLSGSAESEGIDVGIVIETTL
jgi:hypothetical protein